MTRNIVTARLVTDNTHIFIRCQDIKQAFQVQNKLLNIELKEHKYCQIRLRSTPCPKWYKDLTSLFLSGGA